MPELELQSYTTDPTANYLAGICDLELYHGAEASYLYASTRSDGGLTVFEITDSGLRLLDQQSLPGQGVLVPGGGLELLEINGQMTAVVTGLGGTNPPAWQVQPDGGFGASVSLDAGFDGVAAQLFAVDLDGETYLYASWNGSDRISAYHLSESGDLTLTYDSPATPVAGVGAADFTSLSVDGSDYLLVAMSAGNQVLAYEIGADGALTEISSAGAAQGLSIAAPTALTSFEMGGAGYVVVAASGSSSLAVMQLTDQGQLIPTDHVLDGLDSRFSGACHLESLVVGERAYVLAAGNDDGLSLFQLLPDGRLLHLATLSDSPDMGLESISALAMSESDGVVQIYVTSGSEEGVTVLSYDPGPVGLTLVGGAGADRLAGGADQDILYGADGDDLLLGGAGADVLIDGFGEDQLSGGAGADIFVLTHDGQRDRITDFDPGEDMLDLSALPLLHGAEQLSVLSVPGGADLYFADEIIEIRTADGSSLSAEQVASWSIVPLDRIAIAEVVPWQSQQGSAAGDHMAGSAGNDFLYGLGGADLLAGQDGEDMLDGGEGDDTLEGGAGGDTLEGGAGSDTVTYAGAGGAVTVWLDGGANAGYADGDSISNVENLIGSDYDDTLIGDRGGNRLEGAAGRDLLLGLNGADTLDGGSHKDLLLGGAGADILLGQAGNDILLGGAGPDQLEGGAGADIFVFQAGSDLISDFQDNVDLLVLDGTALGLAPSGSTADVLAGATQTADEILFDFGNGNSLTVQGLDNIAALQNDILVIW